MNLVACAEKKSRVAPGSCQAKLLIARIYSAIGRSKSSNGFEQILALVSIVKEAKPPVLQKAHPSPSSMPSAVRNVNTLIKRYPQAFSARR